ncbi:Lrp/AsnC family transcriptional regulator [Candidatus Woesearchaeota archaeon]|nr:Lrp/AsnC family transcriptional regulator [Candidatus Woesearchaeota archaeon]
MKTNKETLGQKIVRNDLRLLARLRTNARQPVLALSKGLDLCRITVTKRLQLLQNSVIQKYTALLDFNQLGFPIRVQLSVHPALEDRSVFERFIRQQGCLNNLYAADGSGYIADLVFQTQIEADRFLSQLDTAFSFVDKQVYFITQELVRESFFHNVLEGSLCK